MAHKKKHGPAPVPPGNRPQAGQPDTQGEPPPDVPDKDGGAPFQEQDAKRRLGGFETAGEHSRQQPGPLNDGQQHSR